MSTRTDALLPRAETEKIAPRPSSPLRPVATRRERDFQLAERSIVAKREPDCLWHCLFSRGSLPRGDGYLPLRETDRSRLSALRREPARRGPGGCSLAHSRYMIATCSQ